MLAKISRNLSHLPLWVRIKLQRQNAAFTPLVIHSLGLDDPLSIAVPLRTVIFDYHHPLHLLLNFARHFRGFTFSPF